MKNIFIPLAVGIIVLLAPCRSARATTVIDIMVVFDTTATNWVESTDNVEMETHAQHAISKINIAMANSEVDIELNLVHTMSVPYTTTFPDSGSLGHDLGKLIDQYDDDFFSVREARDTYGADLVTMLVDTSTDKYAGKGLGTLLTSIYSPNPSTAFSVCSVRSVIVSSILTHEVGHNLGAHHSISQNLYPGPNTQLGKSYSAGWYFTNSSGKKYYTLMAYKSDGTTSYSYAPIYSNPRLVYRDGVAGDPVNGDNARLFGETAGVVAAYRPTKYSVEEDNLSILPAILLLFE